MEVLISFFETVSEYVRIVISLYFQIWLSPFILIPVTILIHFFLHSFDYRMNGGGESVTLGRV